MGLSAGVMTAIGLGMQAFSFFAGQEAKEEQAAAAREEASARQAQRAAELRAAERTRLNQVRAALREKRIQTGLLTNTGAQRSPGSSSVLAGAGALTTQFGANMGTHTQLSAINQEVYGAQARAGEASVAGAMAAAEYQQAGTVGALGRTIFQDLGGGWKTAFGGAGGTSGNSGDWLRPNQAGDVNANA